ncbi:MAG TPA: hypothetical protein PK595_01795 [Bacteroidota bacterium]|nr:hypothetical protein [Bacteroidota bacterium]
METALRNKWKTTLAVLALFAIGMAFVESAVVVYLRLLLYPTGFFFPLQEIQPDLLRVELVREFATILMLATVAWCAGDNLHNRIMFFFYEFGVWDIFYYIFLKITIAWPLSLFDWDLLFLIPLPWLGPVAAPVIVSLFFIGGSIYILQRESQDFSIRFNLWNILGFVLGAIVIVGSFLYNTKSVMNRTAPAQYPWWLYWIGFAIWLVSFYDVVRRKREKV